MRTDWQRKWLDLEVTHPLLQKVADTVSDFAKAFYHHWPTKNIVIAGNSGCGKTHIARRLRQWADDIAFTAFQERRWEVKIPAITFVCWPEVVDGYYDNRFEITQELITTDLLFIDDLGAERDPKQLATDKLCQILSRRERRYTFITTNIQPVGWPEKWDERIADRLLRNTAVLDLSEVPSFSLR